MARQPTSQTNLIAISGRRPSLEGPAVWFPASLLHALFREATLPFWLLGAALTLGIAVRAVPIASGDGFPLNDGGMFYAMVEDLKAAGYALPESTSYNGGEIPFAYSPLPFYLAAGVSDLGGWDTLDVLRFLPLLFSVLTIPAFFLLARAILPSPRLAGLAVLIFATIPRAFNWEIVGGGLTRSPGMFFAVLALWQGYLLFTTRRQLFVVTTAALAALTLLCHMEMGWFTTFSLAIFAAHGGYKANLRHAAVLAITVMALTAPWWLSTLIRLGPAPALAALEAGGHSFLAPVKALTLRFTEEPFFPVALVLGLLGLLDRLRSRDALLPIWLGLIFLLDPRKAATTETIPLAMLAAFGLTNVIWPMAKPTVEAPAGRLFPASTWGYLALSFVLLVYAPLSAIGSASMQESPLYSLSRGNREAMAWVRMNTPADAQFLVVPSIRLWSLDAPSEWFPAMTSRPSVATVQGSEWLPNGEFARRAEGFHDLVNCTSSDVGCVDAWAAENRVDFDYVYVPKGQAGLPALISLGEKRDCCSPLIASLAGSPDYEEVFENEGASIFRRR